MWSQSPHSPCWKAVGAPGQEAKGCKRSMTHAGLCVTSADSGETVGILAVVHVAYSHRDPQN